MNQYVTGAVMKRLREEKNMTQQQLADKLSVSAKTISKWETAKGYPDITLLAVSYTHLDVYKRQDTYKQGIWIIEGGTNG